MPPQDTTDTRPLYVTLEVEDGNDLEELIQHIAELERPAGVISIADPCSGDGRTVSINLGHITETQWETLVLAKELGYYDDRRGGDLDELATRLGVSKSAISQRLRTAEAKIISSILGTETLREEA